MVLKRLMQKMWLYLQTYRSVCNVYISNHNLHYEASVAVEHTDYQGGQLGQSPPQQIVRFQQIMSQGDLRGIHYIKFMPNPIILRRIFIIGLQRQYTTGDASKNMT